MLLRPHCIIPSSRLGLSLLLTLPVSCNNSTWRIFLSATPLRKLGQLARHRHVAKITSFKLISSKFLKIVLEHSWYHCTFWSQFDVRKKAVALMLFSFLPQTTLLPVSERMVTGRCLHTCGDWQISATALCKIADKCLYGVSWYLFYRRLSTYSHYHLWMSNFVSFEIGSLAFENHIVWSYQTSTRGTVAYHCFVIIFVFPSPRPLPCVFTQGRGWCDGSTKIIIKQW